MPSLLPVHQSNRQPFGKVCAELDLLTPEQVEEVLSILKEGTHERFGEVALRLGMLNERGIAHALATQFRLNLIPDEHVSRLLVPEDVARLLPKHFVRSHGVVPTFLDQERQVLSLLTPDPTDLPALRTALSATRAKRLRVYVVTKSAADDLVERMFGPIDEAATQPRRVARRTSAPFGTVVLEPDPSRRQILRRLDAVEGGRTAFADAPEQVTALLESGLASRVLFRYALRDTIEPLIAGWRKSVPDVEVSVLGGYSPAFVPIVGREERNRGYHSIVQGLLLAGETNSGLARQNLCCLVEVVRDTTADLQLSSDNQDSASLAALLVAADDLPCWKDASRTGNATTGALALARRLLSQPDIDESIQNLLDVFAVRLAGGGPIGRHLAAEAVLVCRAYIRVRKTTSDAPEQVLKSDLAHYDTRALKSLMRAVRKRNLIRSVHRRGHRDTRILLALERQTLAVDLERQLYEAGFSIAWADDPSSYQDALINDDVTAIIAESDLDELTARRLMMAISAAPLKHPVTVLALVGLNEKAPAYFGDHVETFEHPVDFQILRNRVLRLLDRTEKTRSLNGRLEDLSAEMLVGALQKQRGRSRLEVGPALEADGHDPDTGLLLLDSGHVVDVSLGRERGDKALTRLLARKSGPFKVEFDGAPFTIALNQAPPED